MKTLPHIFQSLLIVLIVFGLARVTFPSANPNVNVVISCNNDKTITITASATDSDGDLVRLQAWARRYPNNLCMQPPSTETLIIDEGFSQCSSIWSVKLRLRRNLRL